MKKVFMTAMILGSIIVSHAQSTVFKPFKVDLSMGYAVPGGSGSKGGVLFAIEPKYAVNNNLALGLRIEGAVMARATTDASGQTVSGDVKASGSYLATADYYFNTNKFRPFAGLGAGIYSNAAVAVNNGTAESDVAASTKFGAAPRVGFEYGHFRMGVEYNIIGKTGSINNNYLGIKLGFCIGGGRISK